MKESGYLMALKTLFFIRNRHEDYPRNILIPPFRGFVQKYPSSNYTSVMFTMGKGRDSNTSIKSVIAVGLSEKGHNDHLTTTDTAIHLEYMFHDDGTMKENLTNSSIDPTEEVEKYNQDV